MHTLPQGGSFVVIGENIHATRVVLRSGRHIAIAPDGRESIRFEDDRGAGRYLPIPEQLRESSDYAGGKVKHVQAAVLAILGGSDLEAAEGRAYLQALARRQAQAGADWLDLNLDEVSSELNVRRAAMAAVVRTVEETATVPVALDSSTAALIQAGVEASTDPSRLLVNSASIDRLEVLDLAASAGCGLVVNAAGRGGLPTGVEDRVANAEAVVELAFRRGLKPDAIHVDPLVIPVAVEPEAGTHYLEAVSQLRRRLGPAIHLTGGLSNVSFGLPARRLLNDVFIRLAAEAGADSGIIDPVAADLARVFGRDPDAPAYRLAAGVLVGTDPYGMEFLGAFRAGELAGET